MPKSNPEWVMTLAAWDADGSDTDSQGDAESRLSASGFLGSWLVGPGRRSGVAGESLEIGGAQALSGRADAGTYPRTSAMRVVLACDRLNLTRTKLDVVAAQSGEPADDPSRGPAPIDPVTAGKILEVLHAQHKSDSARN